MNSSHPRLSTSSGSWSYTGPTVRGSDGWRRERGGQQACAMARMAAFVVNRTRVRAWPRVSERCRAAAVAGGWDPLWLETSAGDAGTGLTHQALAAGAVLVFAVGGDGTVGACAQALAGTGIPLAIVPRGTANLTARALGVPSGLEAALAVGFGEHERRIDLAIADGITYAAMAGIGVDAAVVGATPGRLK